MRRPAALSFAVVAFAAFAVAGCGTSKGGGQQPDPHPPVHSGDPPGLSEGVVQIFRVTNGNEFPIGFAASLGDSELWFLVTPLNYPPVIGPGQVLKFVYLGPSKPLDENGNQNGVVDRQELRGSSWCDDQAWMDTVNAMRVTESVDLISP